MSKYSKENKIIKDVLKYLKDKESQQQPLSVEGEIYHDIIHVIMELINKNNY